MTYHISAANKPAICEAKPGNCPLGGSHHDTLEGLLAARIQSLYESDTPPPVTAPAAVRAEFLQGQSHPIRRQLALNKATPPAVVATLSESDDDRTREYAAANPNLSAAALQRMLEKEHDPEVFRAAARNKNLTPHLIRVLAARLDDKIGGYLSARDDLPEDVQTLFTTSAVSRYVQMLTAKNHTANVAHGELIGRDVYIDRVLASNPGLLPQHLNTLLHSADEETRNIASVNPRRFPA